MLCPVDSLVLPLPLPLHHIHVNPIPEKPIDFTVRGTFAIRPY